MSTTDTITARPIETIRARAECAAPYIRALHTACHESGLGDFGTFTTSENATIELPAKMPVSDNTVRKSLRSLARDGWGLDGYAVAHGKINTADLRRIAREGAPAVAEIEARLASEETDAPAPAPVETPAPAPAPVAKPGNDRAALVAQIVAMLDGASAPAAIDESAIREIVAGEIAKIDRPRAVTVKIADKPSVDVGLTHKAFDTILTMLANRLHVYAWGPSGTGKTHMVAQLAKALGVEAYYTGQVFDPVQLFGFVDGHGTYHGTEFRKAWEHGGLFLFDEMDGSHPEALAALNMALSNGLCAFPDKTIPAHPDFRCIGGGNTNGQGASREYSTRQKFDGASGTRFAFVHVDYDEALERALTDDFGWCARVQAIRDALRAEKIEGILATPRAIIDGARLLASGMSRAEVEEATIWHGANDAIRNRVEKAIAGAR